MKVRNFLLAGCGGAGGRAESKRESDCAKCERGESASIHFLHDWGLVAVAAAAVPLQCCIRRTGLTVRKVTALARA